MKKGLKKVNKPEDKQNKKRISLRNKILIAAVPCVAVIVAVILLLTSSGIVEAAVSLPNIEAITTQMLNNNRIYRITEVVPDGSDYARTGFYVAGQEPGIAGNWEDHVGDFANPAERTNYVNGDLYNFLNNAGVLGPENTHPITWLENYAEQYPWNVSDTSDMRTLELSETNIYSASITGNAILTANGAYKATYEYEPAENYDSDVYRLPIISLAYYDSDPGASVTYFADPVFVQLNPVNFDGAGNEYYSFNYNYAGGPAEEIRIVDRSTAIYREDANGNFEFVQTLQSELIVNPGDVYFVVADYGKLSDSYGGGHVYGVIDYTDFVETDTLPNPITANPGTAYDSSSSSYYPLGARFTREAVLFTYVESGGDYNITIGAPGESLNVETRIVYYSGGFVNNNWFLRYVFDRDENEVDNYAGSIIVNTISDNDPQLSTFITQSDLVILTDGINLPQAVRDSIYDRATSSEFLPVMFEYELSNNGNDTAQFVRNLASKSTSGGVLPGEFGVYQNIGWTNRNIVGLLTEYGNENSVPMTLRAVRDEIDDENFLRQQQGHSDFLDTKLSDATSLRYIINYGGRRAENMWDVINVLEIQGGLTYTSGTLLSSDLTEGMVRAFIGDTITPYRVTDINITRMTTYEFVGKIEDLNEKYHMIYIGGSARGMNEVSGESRYNDSSMNGLVYTNIGDIYGVNNNADRGAALPGRVAGDDNRRFRLSGNDITPEKMQSIIDFAEAGYPVVVDDRLILGNVSIQVTRPSNSRFVFTATVPDGIPATYYWYRMNDGVVQSVANSNQNPLTVDITSGTSGTFPLSDVTGPPYDYYCNITYGSETVTVGPVTVSRASGGTNGNLNNPGPVYGVLTSAPGSSSLQINENRVDNCSYVYDTLRDILPLENVYSIGQAMSNPASVSRYLNLSKPQIELISQPTPYSMAADGTMSTISGNILEYRFIIRNQTDATPVTTRYDVGLFLDLNGDGRYLGNEKQRDIVVRSSAGVLSMGSDGKYSLAADVEYTVRKQMPSGAVGLFDWSLKITKNDGNKTYVRASQSGLTRIAPKEDIEKTKINILQIASDLVPTSSSHTFNYKGSQQRVNFEWQQRVITSETQIRNTIAEGMTSNTDARAANRYLVEKGYDTNATAIHAGATYYEGIYGKLIADVDDFDITIYTVYAGEVNSVAALQSGINGRPANARTAVGDYLVGCGLAIQNGANNYTLRNVETGGTPSLTDIFMAFNMLIIGFDDSYGTLNRDSANAIVNFINAGKATLFAHDAVTFWGRQTSSSYGDEAAFILRDALALDRYGLSNPSYNALLGAGSSALPIANSLLSNNYSVAWQPKSGKSVTLPQVQGLNSHVLKWFGSEPNNTGSNNTYYSFMNTTVGETWTDANITGGVGRRTTQISQLNSGKITTYPYNVNIPAGETRNVGITHGQWYTVNMNFDDIAVWYCLNSANYIHNDAANAYYIYNTGNVTYTGAGHSMTQGNTTGRNTSNGSAHPSGSGTNTYGTYFNDTGNMGDYRTRSTHRLTDGIEFEARLFVNTMIAAYRAAAEPPEILIKDENGEDIRYKLLPADSDGVIGRNIDELNVFFSFIDGNLDESDGVTLELTYKVGDHLTENPLDRLEEPDGVITRGSLTVQFATGAAGNRNGSLLGGVDYKFAIPTEILNLLEVLDSNGDPANPAVTIRLEVDNGVAIRPGYADIVIRRIELFPLS